MRRFRLSELVWIGLLAIGMASTAGGVARADDPIAAAKAAPAAASLQVNLLDQAQPDECFVSIGNPSNTYPATMPCTTGMPKVNGAYIWGMTSRKNTIWYGTIANTLCQVLAGVLTRGGLPLIPFQTDSYVCEFSASNYLKTHPTVPPELGDWRPPAIFSYDTTTGMVTDRTPDDPLINQTLGIRSAGSVGDLVILAGPALAPFGTIPPGINLFAFQNSTGKYLGSTTLTQYSDIRSWLNVTYQKPAKDPQLLYTGVQNKDGSGSILRWTGNVKNPFQFVVVGNIDNEPSYLAYFNKRIFATTWGGINSPNHKLSGLWASPVGKPVGLLTTGAADKWTEVWRVDKYEIDPVTAQTVIGGAMGVQNGQLYWGTMQVPLTGALAHYVVYPPSGTFKPGDLVAAIVNTTRPVAMFRMGPQKSYMGSVPVELLYGQSLMGFYNPATGWQLRANAMNVEPKDGPAGFGNPFNTYAWSAARYKGKLYFGTFDWSYIAADAINAVLSALGLDPSVIGTVIPQIIETINPLALNYGADLWDFDSTGVASPESLYGVGNYLNYGIRTMLSVGGTLYLGTANPMNLRTDPMNPPLGGFELLGLHP